MAESSARQRAAMWLDPERTSPYKFYQFWLNVSDSDAEKYLKIFTFLSREEIEALAAEHAADQGARPMQRRLARELTVMVHSGADYDATVAASEILFSNKAADALRNLDERTLLDVFEGVPRFEIDRTELEGRHTAARSSCRPLPGVPSKGKPAKWCSRAV